MAPKSRLRTMPKQNKLVRTTKAAQQKPHPQAKRRSAPILSSQPKPTGHFTRQHNIKPNAQPSCPPTLPDSKGSACQNKSKRNRESSKDDVTIALKRARISPPGEKTTIKGPTAVNKFVHSGSNDNTTGVDSQTQTLTSIRSHIYTKTHMPREFEPGLVVSTPWHDADYVVGNAKRKDPHRVETAFGPVYSKPRKLIVIAIFEDHCVTIPIFSFNDKGLMFKTNKDEFVSIRDSLIKSSMPPESKHPSLTFKRAKEYRHLTQGFHLMSASSYAHVTFPMSLRYSLPCIFEGQLLKSSLHQLIKLYNVWAPKFSASSKIVGARTKTTAK